MRAKLSRFFRIELTEVVAMDEHKKLQKEVRELKAEIAMMKVDLKRVDRMATQVIGRPVATNLRHPRRGFQ